MLETDVSKIEILDDAELLKLAAQKSNNTRFVGPIVVEVAGWLRDEKTRLGAREAGLTLADWVGTAVHKVTLNGFSRTAVMNIIRDASERGVTQARVHDQLSSYLSSVERFGYTLEREGRSHKSYVRLIAKGVLWLEAYSFLTELGYQFESW